MVTQLVDGRAKKSDFRAYICSHQAILPVCLTYCLKYMRFEIKSLPFSGVLYSQGGFKMFTLSLILGYYHDIQLEVCTVRVLFFYHLEVYKISSDKLKDSSLSKNVLDYLQDNF